MPSLFAASPLRQLLFSLVLISASSVHADEVARKTFAIPAGPAEKTLKQFSEQSGASVIFVTSLVAGVQTRLVQGKLPIRDALLQMVEGTPLAVTQDEKTGAFAIRRENPDPNASRETRTARDSLPPAEAQSGNIAAGSLSTRAVITGRVYNPATGQYVPNAEISVSGADISTVSGPGGTYELRNLVPGEITLFLHHTGYQKTSVVVTAPPGTVTTRDLDLVAPAEKRNAVVKLNAYVVSSEREGNAKAIMDQKNAINERNTLAADTYGDLATGNVAEFLKYMPGVDIDYVQQEARAPRLRGLDPQYTAVTLDGVRLTTADALVQYSGTDNTAAGDGTRSAGFDTISINSIETIEVEMTTSADTDADAPAGRINMKTKRAFDRKGRFVTWQTNLQMNSEQWRLSKEYGPDDNRNRQFRPTGMLSYADVFFNQRLGIVVTASNTSVFGVTHLVQPSINRVTTAADQRPAVVTGLTLSQSRKRSENISTSLTADFKASDNLTFSLGTNYFAKMNHSHGRGGTFALGGRTTVTGDGLVNFGTSAAGGAARTVTLLTGSQIKLIDTVSIAPRFEYKRGPLTVDGAIGHTRSFNDYDAVEAGFAAAGVVNNLTNVDFTVARTSADSTDFKVTQTGGADWGSLASYTNPRITDSGRQATALLATGELNAKLATAWRFPTFFKTGVKARKDARTFIRPDPLLTWSYNGPGGGANGSWAAYSSPVRFEMGATNAEVFSTSRQTLPAPDRTRIATLFLEHPEYFVNNATVPNYETSIYTDNRDYEEQIDAAYFLTNSKVGRFQFQAGVRWERTGTASLELQPYANSAVASAGYPVTLVGGRPIGTPTTRAGIDYKYSRPRVKREGSYDNWFPSAMAKYTISNNTLFRAGYSHTISRPSLNSLSGVWNIDEDNHIVTAPNPNLKPELSDNFSVRLERYFEPVGNFALGVYQNTVKNLRTLRAVSADDFGYGDDPEFSNYLFQTPQNSAASKRLRGLEAQYSQSLSFLPGILRGLNVSTNYSRNYANERRPGTSPRKFSGGLGFKYERLNVRANYVWTADTPYTSVISRYLKERVMIDVNTAFRLRGTTSVYFQVRNIANVPLSIYEAVAGQRDLLVRTERYGAIWTFGLKGSF